MVNLTESRKLWDLTNKTNDFTNFICKSYHLGIPLLNLFGWYTFQWESGILFNYYIHPILSLINLQHGSITSMAEAGSWCSIPSNGTRTVAANTLTMFILLWLATSWKPAITQAICSTVMDDWSRRCAIWSNYSTNSDIGAKSIKKYTLSAWKPAIILVNYTETAIFANDFIKWHLIKRAYFIKLFFTKGALLPVRCHLVNCRDCHLELSGANWGIII